MEDYTIEISNIEELQTLNNRDELENIFAKAKSAIVNGARVLFVRKSFSGKVEKFDEMDNLEELDGYKENVFKYLN